MVSRVGSSEFPLPAIDTIERNPLSQWVQGRALDADDVALANDNTENDKKPHYVVIDNVIDDQNRKIVMQGVGEFMDHLATLPANEAARMVFVVLVKPAPVPRPPERKAGEPFNVTENLLVFNSDPWPQTMPVDFGDEDNMPPLSVIRHDGQAESFAYRRSSARVFSSKGDKAFVGLRPSWSLSGRKAQSMRTHASDIGASIIHNRIMGGGWWPMLVPQFS